MAATVPSLPTRTAGSAKFFRDPAPVRPPPASSGANDMGRYYANLNRGVNGALPNANRPTNDVRDNGNNGSEHGDTDPEDEELSEEDSEDAEMEISFSVFVDLGAGFPRNDIWSIIDTSRTEVLRRIRSNNFSHGHLNFAGGRVLRFDAMIRTSALALVDTDSELEYVHRMLEQWLMTLLDMVVQDAELSVPYQAGYWSMEWERS